MRLIFFATKGPESIAAQELKEFGILIDKIDVKQIWGTFSRNLAELAQLKTVDDVALSIASFEVSKTSTADEILAKVEGLNMTSYLPTISQIRKLDSRFSITLSKYKAEVNAESLKSALASLLSKKLNMRFTENEHENFDLRINIEQQNVNLSIRLFEKPLHDRNYIKQPYLGSLKPTIAAALYKIALSKVKNKENVNLVDNFCGSGTILCEASLQGANVSGGDINKVGVKIASDCLNMIGAKSFRLKVQSAFSTEWRNGQFNLAISNPPWDEQLKIPSISQLYEKFIKEYRRILSEDGVLCFIAKKPDLLIKFIKSSFPTHKIETRDISFNGQRPTIIVAYSK